MLALETAVAPAVDKAVDDRAYCADALNALIALAASQKRRARPLSACEQAEADAELLEILALPVWVCQINGVWVRPDGRNRS